MKKQKQILTAEELKQLEDALSAYRELSKDGVTYSQEQVTLRYQKMQECYSIAGEKFVKLTKKGSAITCARVETGYHRGATTFCGCYVGKASQFLNDSHAYKIYIQGEIKLDGTISGKDTNDYMLTMDEDKNVYVRAKSLIY